MGEKIEELNFFEVKDYDVDKRMRIIMKMAEEYKYDVPFACRVKCGFTFRFKFLEREGDKLVFYASLNSWRSDYICKLDVREIDWISFSINAIYRESNIYE